MVLTSYFLVTGHIITTGTGHLTIIGNIPLDLAIIVPCFSNSQTLMVVSKLTKDVTYFYNSNKCRTVYHKQKNLNAMTCS